MIEVEKVVVDKLRKLDAGIDVLDGDTAVIRNVPCHRRYFNKPVTNVLLKRPRRGMPFVVCVDEDLRYTGDDGRLAHTFGLGLRRDGWRALGLLIGRPASRDFQGMLEAALEALGSEGEAPRAPGTRASKGRERRDGAEGESILAAFGADLSRLAAEGKAEPTVGRAAEVDEVVSCVMRWGRERLALVAGEFGKTNLLHACARRLGDLPGESSPGRPGMRLVAVDLGRVFAGTMFAAEREIMLDSALGEAKESDGTVLALEHIELALAEVPHGPFLIARALDEGAKLVGTTLPGFVSGFRHPPLAARAHLVPLGELAPREVQEMLAALRGRIAEHHGVEIDEQCIAACVRAAVNLPGPLAAVGLAVLDGAAARAALSGAKVVGPDDICFAASRRREIERAEE